MRMRPLFVALMALLMLTGSALAYWVVSAEPAPIRLANQQAETPAEPEAPIPTAPSQPEREVLRPEQPAPTPAPVPAPAPAPATPKPTEQDLVRELEALNGKEPTEADLARIRELAEALANTIEAENPPKFPFSFSATISGTVVDSSGVGVANAEVMAATVITWVETETGKVEEKLRKRVASPRVSTLGRTDAAGNFKIEYFQGLSKEAKSISFTMHARGADKTTGEAVTFSLNPNESKDGLRLTLPATGVLTGHVVDSYGTAMAGARVMATRGMKDKAERWQALGGQGKGGGESNWVTADAMGNFRIEALTPGTYSISVSHPGYLYVSGGGGADVSAGLETALATDVVLKMQTALKVTLTCDKLATAGQYVMANFYDAQGNRMRGGRSATVGADGVAVFVNAPVEAMLFEISGGVFVTTGKLACSIKEGMHNDHGTVALTMRDMPKRGEKTLDGVTYGGSGGGKSGTEGIKVDTEAPRKSVD